MSLGLVYRTWPLTWFNIVMEACYPHFTPHIPTEHSPRSKLAWCLIITNFLSPPQTWVSQPTDKTRRKWHLWVQTSCFRASLLHSFAGCISPTWLSRWILWTCQPVSRHLPQEGEEMGNSQDTGTTTPGAGSFGRSGHGLGYHSVTDSFCPKSKPPLGE